MGRPGVAIAPQVVCIGESMALFVPAENGPPHQVRNA
jgi:2-dehydro-3-deoxygluconokinase